MKTFDRSDDTAGRGFRSTGSGGGSVPESGAYVPSYKGVNQVLYSTGGAGAVSFWDALAQTSEKDVKNQISVYQGIELSNAYVDYNKSMLETSRDFKAMSPSGEGYIEHITSTHDKLAESYIQKASSGEVSNNMRLVFAKSKENWANQAFRDQNEMMTAHAINKFHENSGSLLIDVMNNPDNVESIYGQYKVAVSTLKGIVPATEYEKFERESDSKFAYSYGMGLIDRDQYAAKELISSPLIRGKVSAQEYKSLLGQAESSIKHKEILALAQESAIQKSRNQQSLEMISDIKLGIAKGTVEESDIESLKESGWISNIQANELKISLTKQNKDIVRSAIKEAEIKEAIKNKTPIPMNKITGADRIKHYEETVAGTNKTREGDKKPPMSLTEKVNLIKENSLVYNVNIPSLSNEVVSTMKKSDSPEKILDACIAITGNENVVALKSIDQETKTFARYMVDQYMATKSKGMIKSFRDDWFKETDVNVEEYRIKQLKQKVKDEELDYESFIKDKLDMGWFSGDLYESMPDEIVAETKKVIETIYQKTGSLTKAQNTAENIILDKFKKTKINGRTEIMYNPPSKDNTGLDDFAINNAIGMKAQEVMEKVEDAISKGTYKGNFKVRAKSKFINKEKIDKYLSESITKGNRRPVEILLNGEWESRNLKIEYSPRADNNNTYRYYVQIDEDNPASKEYIINPDTNKRAQFSFESIRTQKGSKR